MIQLEKLRKSFMCRFIEDISITFWAIAIWRHCANFTKAGDAIQYLDRAENAYNYRVGV